MKNTLIVLLTLVCGIVHAATITFIGVIDSTREGSRFQVGDSFVAHFEYNPKQGGTINRYVIIGGDITISGHKDGQVALGTDPSVGSVYYQVINNSITEITLQAATPNGVIPPIEQFNLNDFTLENNAFGHLTSLPVIQDKKQQ